MSFSVNFSFASPPLFPILTSRLLVKGLLVKYRNVRNVAKRVKVRPDVRVGTRGGREVPAGRKGRKSICFLMEKKEREKE